MNAQAKISLALSVLVVIVCGWVLYFDNAWVLGMAPKTQWIQTVVKKLGKSVPADVAADEDPDNTKNDIPVHTAHISRATMHAYIPGYGTIAPRMPRPGEMSGSASIASPVVGVVSEVLCHIGQEVKKGDALVQLDDRLAKAAEDQAQSALTQAQEALQNLKASRPKQMDIASLAVENARAAVDAAQKNFDRQNQLVTEKVKESTDKTFQQAQTDLATAKNALSVAEKQLALQQSSQNSGTFTEEAAKVTAAQSALAAAKTQRQMMRIIAPIDGTVVQLNVNPGEGVDTTKTMVQLIAMDRLLVDVDVFSNKLPMLSEGLPAIVLPDAASVTRATTEPAPGTTQIIGKVNAISPDVNPKTGTVRVDIDLPPGPMVRPGLFIGVLIIAEEHKDVLVVPKEAVITDENGDSVIATLEGDQATHKTVKVGLKENGLVEIEADGLKEGDTVITAGAYGLPQATRVRVVD